MDEKPRRMNPYNKHGEYTRAWKKLAIEEAGSRLTFIPCVDCGRPQNPQYVCQFCGSAETPKGDQYMPWWE